MRQKGFVPIIVLIIAITVLGAGMILVRQKSNPPSQVPAPIPTEQSTTPTPTGTTIPTNTKPLPNPTSSAKPQTPTPTPTAQQNQNSNAKKNTCEVNVIYGKLSGTASDPLLVTLAAAFTSYNSAYLAEAQWDFDGNGSWDTDSKSLNGNIEHTYPQAGSYTPKLQVKGSDGATTDVCSKNLTVPSGTTVRLTGKVYADVNCNNTPEPSEGGVAEATVQIMKMPEYSIFATLSTDGNGNYNFSQNVQPNNALSVSPTFGAVPSGYKSNPKFNPPTFALNSSQSSINVDIPLVPYANLGSCQ